MNNNEKTHKTENKDKNLFIVDLNSHIHRAYHSAIAKKEHLKPNSFFNGRPNFIIRGVVNLIEKEMELTNIIPDYICVVLDHEGKNFRHDIYPDYKKNREKTPEDLDFMRKCIFKILSIKGYSIIKKPNVEADDVIGTLAKKASRSNIKVTIFTKDKDMFQLVDDNVKIFNGQNNMIYGIDEIIEAKNVKPNQIVDYLTLLGDVADNVAGVPSCGDLTASKILQHHTLNEVLENPTLITNIEGLRSRLSIAEYIANNVDQIRLMKKVVTLKTNLNLNTSLNQLIKKEENFEYLNIAYSSLGLKYYPKKNKLLDNNNNNNNISKNYIKNN